MTPSFTLNELFLETSESSTYILYPLLKGSTHAQAEMNSAKLIKFLFFFLIQNFHLPAQDIRDIQEVYGKPEAGKGTSGGDE